MKTTWNDVEDEALDYLPHRAQVLYLRGLRRFMDYRTGIVGIKRKISLKGLAEVLEVHPQRGSTERPFKPTTDEVRAVLAMLERAGLIEQLPKVNKFDPIAFRLPFADVDLNRSNEEPQGNPKEGTPKEPQGANPVMTRVLEGFDRSGAPREPQGMNPIHPESGYISDNSELVVLSSSEKSAEGAQDENNQSSPAQTKQRPGAAVQTSCGRYWGDETDLAIAREIYTGVQRVTSGQAKEPNWPRWANAVRLMRERDGRDPVHIQALFAFANRDPFWSTNILSPDTLREKWVQLAAKYNQQRGGSRCGNSYNAYQPSRPASPIERMLAAERAEWAAPSQRSNDSGVVEEDGGHVRPPLDCEFWRGG